MFAEACKVAREFTRPVVLSHRSPQGDCGTVVAAFVVLNEEGWCLTAAHILEAHEAMSTAKQAYDQVLPKIEKIEADATLNRKTKKKRLKELETDGPFLLNHSDWWGKDGLRMAEEFELRTADLAVFRLEPFEKGWVSRYPVIKDPTRPIEPGTSLCRMGYPFHEIESVFDDSKNVFIFPPGSVPPPLFPVDGIMTREVVLRNQNPGADDPDIALKLLETCNPGLKGQSGGPVFDIHGTVWGIQSRTQHFPLEFEPTVWGSDGKETHREHHFLNVGWAVHPETICAFLDHLGITYDKSAY